MVKLLINDEEVKFETTIFPDGTSQVWKIDDSDVDFDPNVEEPTILWQFENESELMHVLQLSTLVQKHFNTETVALHAPYLPYGRQDKDINNKASFALNVFKDILYHNNITRIETFDPHSDTAMVYESIAVKHFHVHLLNKSEHDVICYPDKGAANRYKSYGLPVVYCEKIRDQLTGNILGLKVNGDTDLTNKRVLIIDDICDGGMTFIKVAEALKPFNPKQVDLAVSHGLFSKGKACLYDAGITNIYTTNSLPRNPEGFKVW